MEACLASVGEDLPDGTRVGQWRGRGGHGGHPLRGEREGHGERKGGDQEAAFWNVNTCKKKRLLQNLR